MPIERVKIADAIDRREFHTRLREWLKTTSESRVGDPDVPGVTPWVYVEDASLHYGSPYFKLHADAGREAVASYLMLVDQHGDDLLWTVVPNKRGNENAVAYGPEQIRIVPFYFYHVEVTKVRY